MKRPTFLIGVLIISVFVWVYGSNVQDRKAGYEKSDTSNDPASPLTKEEERDLRTLVPQTLSWFAIWSEPEPCLWNGEIVEAGFMTQYNQYKLQEVPMGLDIGENELTVYFDSLHTYLRFKRLHSLGLTPGDPTFNCDPSYADYKAGVKLREARTRPFYEAARRQQQITDPKAAEVMERARRREAAKADKKARRNEIRSYLLRSLAEESPSPEGSWTNEKKQLYERVLAAIRLHMKSSYQSGDSIHATVPGFELGDPAIYILVKGHYYDNQYYILWIPFDRDQATGEYLAHDSQPFGLPDEIKSLVPLIKKKRVVQLTLRCP